MTALAGGVACTCIAIFLHTVLNLLLLRRPQRNSVTHESIAVLIPARNESQSIAKAVASACAQLNCDDLSITVLDDGSTDATAEIARAVRPTDPRLHVLPSPQDPPSGWLGKPWACQQLGQLPHIQSADVFVFMDADVVLEPHAIAAAVALMRSADLDVVCPYPRQVTSTTLQKLVQPLLLQWSWAAMLPLRIAERSRQSSLTAGNGQFFVVDARVYRRAGGHAVVAAEVIEDIALVRAIKRAGGRGGVVDGTHLATCTMYYDNPALIAGFTKSLWAAFGSRTAAGLIAMVFTLLFIVPVPATFITLSTGAVGSAGIWATAYTAAAASRFIVAMRTGGPLGAALAHPVSIAVFIWLLARSWHAKATGTLTWKGRSLP